MFFPTERGIGAVAGAILLLELPSGAFKAIVPALIVLSLVLVVFGRQVTAWLAPADRVRRRGSRRE